MDEKEFEKKIRERLESFSYDAEPSPAAMSDFMSRLGTTALPPTGWTLWKPYLVAAAMVTSVAFNVYFWRLSSDQSDDIRKLTESVVAISDREQPADAFNQTFVDTIYVYKEVVRSTRLADADTRSHEGGNAATASAGAPSAARPNQNYVTADGATAGAPASSGYYSPSAGLVAGAGSQAHPLLLDEMNAYNIYGATSLGDSELSLSRNDIRRIRNYAKMAVNSTSVNEVVPEKKEARGIPLLAGLTAGVINPMNKHTDSDISVVAGAQAKWRVSDKVRIGTGAETYKLKYAVTPIAFGPTFVRKAPEFDRVKDFPDAPEKVMVESKVLEVPLMVNYYPVGDGKKVNPYLGIGASAKWVSDQQFVIERQQGTEVLLLKQSDLTLGTFNVEAGITGVVKSKLTWQASATLGEDLSGFGRENIRFDNLKLQAGLAYNFF